MNPIPNLIRWTWLTIVFGFPATLIAQESVAPLTPDEIREWVSRLNGDTFAGRQNAMRQLIKGGTEVIGPLHLAIKGGEPETQMRAVSVIARLAISGDPNCQRQAQDVLAELSRSENRDIRQLALRAIGELGEAMQTRAIQDLKNLGADIQIEDYFDGVTATTKRFTIMIGPEFRGSILDFEMLRWLKSQTTLTLIGKRITDEVVAHAAEMPALFWLTIKRGAISNESIQTIARSPSLRYLHLYYVDIDDACAKSLVEMKRLIQLRLFGTRVTREKGIWMQQTMVSTEVDWRNGAFLGIYFNDTDGPCVVNDVVAESAADRAGFRPNDKVIRFANKDIETGRQFLKAVADYSPGDKAKATIFRNGNEMELEFELGRFPDVETFKSGR